MCASLQYTVKKEKIQKKAIQLYVRRCSWICCQLSMQLAQGAASWMCESFQD
jgi:hypothetical protein